jgi:RNA polymerase sigma-70 factor (ECF subfamily)
MTVGSRFAPLCQPALVNGAPAIVVPAPGGPLAAVRLTISGDRIAVIELILDPAVLRAFTVADDGSFA